MNNVELVVLAVVLALAALDSWAIWSVFNSPFYSRGQRFAQTGIVLLLPVLGASIVLYLARANPHASSGSYPVAHTDAEDVGFNSNYDVGSHE